MDKLTINPNRKKKRYINAVKEMSPRMATLTIHIPLKTHKEIKVEAAINQVTMTQIVVDAFNYYNTKKLKKKL